MAQLVIAKVRDLLERLTWDDLKLFGICALSVYGFLFFIRIVAIIYVTFFM